MKNLKVALVAACAVVVGTTAALGSTWTGKGDGVKWSDAANWDTAPAKGSAVTFPAGSTAATVVDADFTSAKLGDVTLASGFDGSVTLQRPLSIASFKMEGGLWDQNHNAQTNTGNLYLYGGTYKFKGTSLVLHAGNFSTSHKADCTVEGGHLHFERNQNHGITFNVGSKFESVRIGAGPEANVDVAARRDNTMGIYGTWTVTGDLELEAFQFTQSGTFTVGGDVYVRRYANGGSPTVYFTDGGEHKVVFEGLVDGYDPGCVGVVASNGTTVVVSSENKRARFGRMSVTAIRSGATPVALRAVNGATLDFSSLDQVSYEAYSGGSNIFGTSLDGHILMPQKVVMRGGMMSLVGNGLVFNDLATYVLYAGINLAQKTTNYVNGTLEIHGNGFTTDYQPTTFDDPACGTLVFRGDFVCTTNLYNGYQYSSADYNYDRWKGADGFGRLVAAGTGDQHGWITNGCLGASLIVDKPEGTKLVFHQAEGPLTVYRGTARSKASPAVVVKSGTFVSSDIILRSCYGESGFYQHPGTTLVASNALFELQGRFTKMRFMDPIGTLNIRIDNSTDHNFLLDGGAGGNALTTTVMRALNHYSSRYFGATTSTLNPHVFDLKGDLYIAPSATYGATGSIHFTGEGEQHYNFPGPGNCNFQGNIVIDKPSGAVVLDTDYYAQCATHWRTGKKVLNADFKRGTLDLNGHNFNVGGTLTIGNGMTIVSRGGDNASSSDKVVVEDGATLAFVPREKDAELVPIVTATNSLSLPSGAGEAVTVRALPEVTPDSATTVPLFSYGSFASGKGYAADKWSFDLQPMMIRPKVKSDEAEKLVDFVYRYKHGLMLFLR